MNKTESVKISSDVMSKLRDHREKKGKLIIQWFVEEAILEKLKREQKKK